LDFPPAPVPPFVFSIYTPLILFFWNLFLQSFGSSYLAKEEFLGASLLLWD